jgi:hypothetical protein
MSLRTNFNNNGSGEKRIPAKLGSHTSQCLNLKIDSATISVVIGRRMSIQKMQFRCTPRVTT